MPTIRSGSVHGAESGHEANQRDTWGEPAMRRIYRETAVPAALVMMWWLTGVNHLVSAAGGDAVKGKAIYQAKCMTCHGPQGKGDGPLGKQLKPPAEDFTSAASKKKSEAELLHIIQNGKPKTAMTAWKTQLTGAEIQDVLAYVLTLRK